MSTKHAAVIGKTFSIARSSCANPRDTPFAACGTQRVDGTLEQRSTVDQFHSCFGVLTAKYESPTAMCGYFSIANAIILSRHMPARRVTREEVNQVFRALENPSAVAEEAERVMAFLQECRNSYVKTHPSDFDSQFGIAHYMSDWVANYEISDYLLGEAQRGSLIESVHFFRYNQMPELATATHEERLRLEDERCFGIAVPGASDSKVIAELEPGATRFFVERFLPEHILLRPEHWVKDNEGTLPPVFVVDVNDHFVAAVPLIIEPSSDSPGGPTLLVVNTTRGDYLKNPALVYLFDLAFGTQHA